MDESQGDRQRVLAALDLVSGRGNAGLLEDDRSEWNIMEEARKEKSWTSLRVTDKES